MRSMAFTGFAFDGTMAVAATPRVNDDGSVVFVDKDGLSIGDPNEYRWSLGYSRVRHAAEAWVGEDGRRNGTQVPMFFVPARMLRDKAGKLRGRFGTFEAMLQEYADRAEDHDRWGTVESVYADLTTVLTQAEWEEAE
jgi:hypothetical protein